MGNCNLVDVERRKHESEPDPLHRLQDGISILSQNDLYRAVFDLNLILNNDLFLNILH